MLLYLVFLFPTLGVTYYIAASGARGVAYVTLFISGVLALLLAYQVLQHYRDLRGSLAETVGVVQRKWARADLIIAWQSHYITIDRAVFRLRPEDYIAVDEGMLVKVVHFPNTLNVVSVHELARSPQDPSASI
jgi:hypothetical protein